MSHDLTLKFVSEIQPTLWADPDLSYLGSGRRAAPKFPLIQFGSSWANWIEQRAKAASAPADYVGTGLLAVTAAVLGNVRWVQAGAAWVEPSVLWICNIGSPSSGKSPAMDADYDLLKSVEDILAEDFNEKNQLHERRREIAKGTLEKWQADVKMAVKDGCDPPFMPPEADVPPPLIRPRIRVTDVTIEKMVVLSAGLPRGLLQARDELSGLLTSFDRYGGSGSDRAFMLEAFGGRTYTVDRVKSSEPIVVNHLSVSILGALQPDKIAVITSSADDGLAARFLYAWPDTLPTFSLTREFLDDRAAKDAFARLAELKMEGEDDEDVCPEPVRLPLEPEAEDVIEEFGRIMSVRCHQATGFMAGVLGKARGNVLRLANVLEHLWWCGEIGGSAPEKISRQAVAAAIRLMEDYFVPMAECVFADASVPAPERAAIMLIKHIRHAGIKDFNARALRRKVGGLVREAADMKQACDLLEEAGLVRSTSSRAGATPGRKTLDYEVNPRVFQAP